MKAIVLIGALLCIAAAQAAQVARFDNYQVFSVRVDTDAHHDAVRHLEDGGDVSLWNGLRVGHTSDLMVAPHKAAAFREIADRLGLNSTLKVANVQT